MTVEQKMARSVETWRKCDPILMASQSQAALIFAFRDMKRDILVLADEAERLQARVAELESQLPEGMKHCTIQFRECEKGHGWLTASNWVQHECATCERDELRRRVAELIHYPDCWDTVAYPELKNALDNIDADYQGCTECAEKSIAKVKAEAVREAKKNIVVAGMHRGNAYDQGFIDAIDAYDEQMGKYANQIEGGA